MIHSPRRYRSITRSSAHIYAPNFPSSSKPIESAFFRSVCKFLLIPSRLRLPPHTRFRRKAAFNRRYRRHETGLATIYHRKKRRKRMFLPIYAIVKINSPRVCFKQFFVPLFLSPEAPDDTSDRALFYEVEKDIYLPRFIARNTASGIIPRRK